MGLLKGDSQPSTLKNRSIKLLTTIWVKVAHTPVASSKPKTEVDAHSDTCVDGDDCLVIYDHNKPVNSSYDSQMATEVHRQSMLQ